jgi:hypothetical protein
VYGAIPPDAVAMDVPLHKLHDGEVIALVAVICAGEIIVVTEELVHPFESVTITVYIPLQSEVAVVPVCPLLQFTRTDGVAFDKEIDALAVQELKQVLEEVVVAITMLATLGTFTVCVIEQPKISEITTVWVPEQTFVITEELAAAGDHAKLYPGVPPFVLKLTDPSHTPLQVGRPTFGFTVIGAGSEIVTAVNKIQLS